MQRRARRPGARAPCGSAAAQPGARSTPPRTARPGRSQRDHLDDRRRRPDARRRPRPPDPRLRPDDRQPAGGRGRAGGRQHRDAPARTRTPICSGRCAAAAATSASSPRSRSGRTRSATSSAGPTFWPIEQAAEVLRGYREFLPTLPRETSTGFFAFLTVPPAPPFPEELHMQKVCGIVWCSRPAERGASALIGADARRRRAAHARRRRACRYPALQSVFDGALPDRATSGTGGRTSSTS